MGDYWNSEACCGFVSVVDTLRRCFMRPAWLVMLAAFQSAPQIRRARAYWLRSF
jgi:hypothetical protein